MQKKRKLLDLESGYDKQKVKQNHELLMTYIEKLAAILWFQHAYGPEDLEKASELDICSAWNEYSPKTLTVEGQPNEWITLAVKVLNFLDPKHAHRRHLNEK